MLTVSGLETFYGSSQVLFGVDLEVAEGEVRFLVDLRKGQKTGLFLDQRENRLAAGTYAKGEALDCFSYQGAFALHLARHDHGHIIARRRSVLLPADGADIC